MLNGKIIRGNLNMVNRVNVTNAVFGSKLLSLLVRIKTANEIVDMIIGEQEIVKLERAVKKPLFIKLFSSLPRTFSINA
jgi:hypothetical protein